jgi:protein-disulfide isomerase
VAILLTLPSLAQFSWLPFVLVLLALAGGAVGYLLLAKEMGIVNEAVEVFCATGKNTNCDKVLKADINLFGIGLSDAVVIYFGFQLIMLAFAQGPPAAQHSGLQILAWLSVLTIPVMLFSLYYQYAIAKTWCRLCLVVALILGFQLAVFGAGVYTHQLIPFHTIMITSGLASALLLAITSLIVLAVKTHVLYTDKLSAVGLYGNKVKHATPVFTYLLAQQSKIDDRPFKTEMMLGDASAPIKITMATNLYCAPCSTKHEALAELLEQYPGQVSVALRFVPGGKDDTARKETVPYVLDYWLTNIQGKPDESALTQKLMQTWFSLDDLEKFKQKYPLNNNRTPEANSLAQLHYAWVEETEISATPTLFVNGYSIPKHYTIEEVITMTPGLVDWFKKAHEGAMPLR